MRQSLLHKKCRLDPWPPHPVYFKRPTLKTMVWGNAQLYYISYLVRLWIKYLNPGLPCDKVCFTRNGEGVKPYPVHHVLKSQCSLFLCFRGSKVRNFEGQLMWPWWPLTLFDVMKGLIQPGMRVWPNFFGCARSMRVWNSGVKKRLKNCQSFFGSHLKHTGCDFSVPYIEGARDVFLSKSFWAWRPMWEEEKSTWVAAVWLWAQQRLVAWLQWRWCVFFFFLPLLLVVLVQGAAQHSLFLH